MHSARAHELLNQFFQNAAAEFQQPHHKYCRHFAVSKWRFGNKVVPTKSFFLLCYTKPLRLTVSLTFGSIEQFYHIKGMLEELSLCKLNEKHLRLNGRKIKPSA